MIRDDRFWGFLPAASTLYAGAMALLVLAAAAVLFAALRSAPADAAYIRFDSPKLRYADQRLSLLARADVHLSPAIRAGLDNGVPLEFVLEFELLEPRVLLPDRRLLRLERRSILRYYELTRHYRLQTLPLRRLSAKLPDAADRASRTRGEHGSIGGKPLPVHSRMERTDLGSGSSRNFRSLLDALAALGDLRGLPVVAAGGMLPAETHAALSLKLDTGALPLPLQPVWSSTWRLSSGELTWPATPVN